jgi:hypothetical protein
MNALVQCKGKYYKHVEIVYNFRIKSETVDGLLENQLGHGVKDGLVSNTHIKGFQSTVNIGDFNFPIVKFSFICSTFHQRLYMEYGFLS